MKRYSGPRKNANLPKSLQRQLRKYALAASGATPAAGKIVHTKAHPVTGVNKTELAPVRVNGAAYSAPSAKASRLHSAAYVSIFVALLALSAMPSTQAQNFTVLYTFKGGTDGAFPAAGLVMDANGNLYGTTKEGGDNGCYNCGTVFKITRSGKETVLLRFKSGADGVSPEAGVVLGSNGYFYGSTLYGGLSNCNGCGTVFSLGKTGKETVLHAFNGGTDGAYPIGTLIRDKAGNLYGTTIGGGDLSCGVGGGCGTVFKIDEAGEKTVLYNFNVAKGGWPPQGTLVRDPAGNLYGTTQFGGDDKCIFGQGYPFGCGVVFKLAGGVETVLHRFSFHGNDGVFPSGGLIMDTAGNLYGTTVNGGESGCGTVFKMSTTGKETILYSFAYSDSDGCLPNGDLLMDEKYNLYGTTSLGGRGQYGTVFKLSKAGKESVLHSFSYGVAGGADPNAGLAMDRAGNLYGTTLTGGDFNCNGAGCGVVYKLTP
jgi:uncharacterized repeat protein (TIGR03803 family)